MITVILIMLCGIGIGYLLRGKQLSIVPKLITVSIYLLLFFLGVTVGNNPQIMNNLHTIGLDALIITLAAVFGSYILAFVVYKFFFKGFK